MFLNLLNKTFLLNNRLNTFKIIKRLNSWTIYSLSTNIKESGSAIAVIRISGHKSFEALRHLIRNKRKFEECICNPRKAFFSRLYDKTSNEMLDSSVVICFEQPFSYTGEDMCELHVHGSHAVITGVLNVLSRIDGFRPAEVGEFTKRALINNKMNLIEVEAIHDLIKSQTQTQRRRALSALNGTTTQLYDNWRTEIIKLMANIEAVIDFGEEELIEESVFNNLKSQMNGLIKQINKFLANSKHKSELIKDGLKITIVGEPNVGKSTLINKLCERDLAIVSPISGTTRDIIETWININGYSVSISDTAGIKDLTNDSIGDPIEREGIVRAIKRAKNSDLILLLIDSSKLINNDFSNDIIESNYLKQIMDSNKRLIYIINKIDLLSKEQYIYLQQKCNQLLPVNDWYLMSCKTSNGFQHFVENFSKIVEELCGNPMTEMLFMSSRHEAHLLKAVQQISLSVTTLDKDIGVSAHHLREAVQQISFITGKITTDDILNVIFRDFCIGK